MRKGWEIKRLGDCFKLRSGELLTAKMMNSNGSYPVYGGNGISGYHDQFNLSGSNVIVGRVGALCGNVRHITEDIWLTDNGFQAIDYKIQFDHAFLTYLLNYKNLRSFARQAAQPVISNSSLTDVVLEFPKDIPRQQYIVAILNEALEAIDQAKTNTEKNLQNAKELFKSELNSIFTNTGEGWVEKKLNQISENLDNKRIPITKNVRSSGKYPYYGASGIVDYVADYIFDDDLLLVSEDGANLLARTYPIAFPVRGKIWVNNHAHILKFKDLTTQRFVEFYLNSIRLDPFVSGMAQPKLNQAMLNKIPIPFPPLGEQKRIVSQLDTLSAETKQLEENYRKKLDSLEELKKSILRKAFSGELTTVKEIAL
jgi:type I restriction enzyme S subunit